MRGAFNTNNQIKFKTSMLKSSLSDYSDVYKGTVTTIGAERPLQPGKQARTQQQILQSRKKNEINKGEIFKSCEPFTDLYK